MSGSDAISGAVNVGLVTAPLIGYAVFDEAFEMTVVIYLAIMTFGVVRLIDEFTVDG